MPKDQAAQSFAQSVARPFAPAREGLNNLDLETKLRIAHALEYIAAQLGEMNGRRKAADETGQ